MYVRMYACIYIYMCVCVCVCIYGGLYGIHSVLWYTVKSKIRNFHSDGELLSETSYIHNPTNINTFLS